MHEMDIQLYPGQTIRVHCINFSGPPPKDHALDFLEATLSSLLFDWAQVFKLPFVDSMALISRYLRLDPDHTFLSPQHMLDTTVGTAGVALGFLPWMVGVGLAHAAQTIEATPIKYYESSHTKKCPQTWRPFNVLTRNCALLSLDAVCNHSKLRPAKERIPELINSIKASPHRIDILCLQEVFSREHAEAVVMGLRSHFKYFLYDIAPEPILEFYSGLVVATNYPIKVARYFRLPLPVMTGSDQFPGFSFSVEGLTNKGVIFVVVENGDPDKAGQYDMIVDIHGKSNAGSKYVEQIRSLGYALMIQAMFNYIEELALIGISICHIYLAGDLNVSDVQETGERNYERSRPDFVFNAETKDWIDQRAGQSVVFQGVFPNPNTPDTWLKEGPIVRKKNGSVCQPTQKGVAFDQNSVFVYQSRPGRCLWSYHMLTKKYHDQGCSLVKTQSSDLVAKKGSSDHDGVLTVWKIKKQNKTNENRNAEERSSTFSVTI